MQQAILVASIVYLMLGAACSVSTICFFRAVSYRPAVWLVAASFTIFALLWPVIVLSAFCYLIGHIYRTRTGEDPLSRRTQSWSESGVKIPTIATPRR